MNNYDIWADYGPAAWDIPHRFVASYIYDVPFFKTSSQPFLRHAIAGWQIGGVTTLQSGSPVNITVSGDPANIGISGQQRPNLVGSVPSLNCQPNTAGTTDVARRELINCYDASAFAAPAAFTFGNAPRNLLRGPGSSITDLSLMKNFGVGGRARLQIRAEMFNVFNRVNYSNPGSTLNAATFGRISGAGSMRQVQLGGKLLF
jgi:hypothetical protein